MADPLYWITIDCKDVSNKVENKNQNEFNKIALID